MSFLSAKAINEYIEIYKEEFGKDLSFDEAQKQAENLLKLIKLIITSNT